MSSPTRHPAPATPETGWRVEVAMPVHTEGRNRGRPVGWQSLNCMPGSVAEKIDWDRARREWRVAAYQAIVAASVPRGLDRIELTVEFRFPDNRTRDPGNFEATIKAIIDAFSPKKEKRVKKSKMYPYGIRIELGRGVIPDDNPRHLVRPNPIVGKPLGRTNPIKGIVILHIRQLPVEEV